MLLNDFCIHSGIDNTAFCKYLKDVIKPNWDQGPWVAGGSIRRLITGKDPLESDIDVFFQSKEQKEAWVERILKENPQATYKNNEYNTTIRLPDGKVLQAVHVQYYVDAYQVISLFDFTICQLVTDGEELAMGQFTLWDIARKRLALNVLQHPVSTMRRMIKYTQQGYYACPGMMIDFLRRVAANPNMIDSTILYFD